MRKVLDTLYWFCGVWAGIFMAGIAVFILIALAGALLGFVTRSMDEFAGYSMAASAFLALPYTFHLNEHIRVTLFIHRFKGRLRQGLEIWCHLLAIGLSGFFAWYSFKMTIVSWQINDLSQGLIPAPLWIPQLSMAIGTGVLTIAVADRLFRLATGGLLLDDQQESMVGR